MVPSHLATWHFGPGQGPSPFSDVVSDWLVGYWLTDTKINKSKMSGPWFDIKMLSYQYWKLHCWDKTVVRSFNLHNGIPYTGKTPSLYWIGPQVMQTNKMITELRKMNCVTSHSHSNFHSLITVFVNAKIHEGPVPYPQSRCCGTITWRPHMPMAHHNKSSATINYRTVDYNQFWVCQNDDHSFCLVQNITVWNIAILQNWNPDLMNWSVSKNT